MKLSSSQCSPLPRPSKTLVAILTSLTLWLVFIPATVAGKLYRWKDDKGQIHYSDRIPTAQAKKAYRQLDAHGITVKINKAQLTDQQKAKQTQLKALGLQQQQQRRQRINYDRMLLQTFSSETEIDGSYQEKIILVETRIAATQLKIKQFRQYLDTLHQQAANAEIAGRKVAKKTVQQITETKQKINQSRQTVDSQNKSVEKIKDQANRDKQRFKLLKSWQK